MSRTALLLLLVGCGDRSQRTPPATTGTPTDTATTASPPVPTWTHVLDDTVWESGVDPHHPTLARHEDGSSAVFFDLITASGARSVMLRTFGPDLGPLGPAREVAPAEGELGRPDGAWLEAEPLADVGPVLVWHGRTDVFAARRQVGGEALLQTTVNGPAGGVAPDKGQPDLAVLDGGDVVVVYHFADPGASPESRIHVRRLSSLLDLTGDEREVGTSAQVSSPPDVAALPGGGYAVAWTTRTSSGGTVELSVYDAQDDEVDRFRVDAHAPPEAPTRPNLAVLDDGHLAVTWRVQDDAGQPRGAYARFYAPDLEPLSEVLTLDPTGQRPELAAGPGLFLLTWEPLGAPRGLAQAFDPRGLPLEDPWEPLAGSLAQQHVQAGFAAVEPDSWSVLFTSDRGSSGSRTLGRSAWTVRLDR